MPFLISRKCTSLLDHKRKEKSDWLASIHSRFGCLGTAEDENMMNQRSKQALLDDLLTVKQDLAHSLSLVGETLSLSRRKSFLLKKGFVERRKINLMFYLTGIDLKQTNTMRNFWQWNPFLWNLIVQRENGVYICCNVYFKLKYPWKFHTSLKILTMRINQNLLDMVLKNIRSAAVK